MFWAHGNFVPDPQVVRAAWTILAVQTLLWVINIALAMFVVERGPRRWNAVLLAAGLAAVFISPFSFLSLISAWRHGVIVWLAIMTLGVLAYAWAMRDAPLTPRAIVFAAALMPSLLWSLMLTAVMNSGI